MFVQSDSFEAATGLPQFIAFSFIAVVGAVVGSFLNVVIHRVPREQSIVFPNSACPECGTAIKPYDNIPIVGWMLLGGKCRSCKRRISMRYPLVEALTAVLFMIVLMAIGWNLFLIAALIFVSVMVALIFIDGEHMILPDVITYPLIFFALAARIFYPLIGSNPFTDVSSAPLSGFNIDSPVIISLIAAFLGAVAGGGLLWAVGAAWKRLRGVDAMGLGDVKMMAGVGALLGWKLTLLSIFVAAFAGSIIGIAIVAKQKERNFQAQIPFGVFLGIGAIVSLLFGDWIITWYVNRFV